VDGLEEENERLRHEVDALRDHQSASDTNAER
jgi:hypothetical protein